MALCLLLLTLVMQRRFLLVLPFGFLLGGLTLLVSMMGQSNPQITHLMPVLQSPLLSLHVCVIMITRSVSPPSRNPKGSTSRKRRCITSVSSSRHNAMNYIVSYPLAKGRCPPTYHRRPKSSNR